MKKIIFVVYAAVSCSLVWGATVDTVAVHSASMHKEIPCVIVKPDSYSGNDRRYPVVYLLHGHSGSYASWIKGMPNIKDDADLYQILLVCPDGGNNSWYFDSPIDSTRKYETHVSKEVVEFVDANYRTIPDRNHRAITGLSMGGHGALYIALRHADTFGAAGSTSGGVDIRPFKNRWQIDQQIGDTVRHEKNWETMTIVNMIDRYPAASLAIIFDCGTEDFFYAVNTSLHEKMLRLHLPHDYSERPGGHTVAYWKNSIDFQLLYFQKYFAMHKNTP